MKRCELSINSKYSKDSIVDIRKMLKRANVLNLEGIAITDFNDVNSFFELENELKNYRDLDIIYGTKVKVVYKNILIKIDILVKNRLGLKNLYKILTLINTNNEDMDIYNLFNICKGLLIGLNVTNNNIYELLKKLSNDEIYEFINVFDYLIINPIDNHDYIKKIIEVSKQYNKLVVASNDVKYLTKEDKLYYEIFKGKEVNNYNYLMGVDELSEEFSYLDNSDIEKIVLNDPHKINLLIDSYIDLLPEIDYDNEGIKDELERIIYEKANYLYKNNIPYDIKKRIDDELDLINDTNAYNIIINSNLVKISNDLGYETCTRGAVCSSYINYLLGITKINPIDYNLNYTDFYGSNKNNILRIAINYDERVKPELIKYLNNEFGNDKVLRGGTIGTIINIEDRIKDYENNHNITFNNDEKEKINDKLSNIKRTNGKLIASYFCIPKNIDINEISPLIDLCDLTTMIEYHKIQKNIIKICIMEPSFIELYNDLIKNIDVKNIDLNDKKVWEYINSNEKEEMFKIEPLSIIDLAKIWVDIHKTDDWIPFIGHGIEYALVHYKLAYIKYYYNDMFEKIANI